jgi:hypothetical protein
MALVRAAIEIGSALHGGIGVVRQSHYIQPRLLDAQSVQEYQPWG